MQHGTARIDHYHWLRDRNWQKIISGHLDFHNPEILKYIQSENNYTKTVMKSTLGMQKKLYQEILSHIKENKTSCPMKKQDYFYYIKEEKGKNYPIFCRKHKSLNNKEEIYFDINEVAKGHSLFQIKSSEVSPDNQFFAYMINTSGSLEASLKVRNLEKNKDFEWEIPNTNASFVWAADSQSIYYVLRHPKNSRGYQVFQFNIFEGPKSKRLIFEKPHELNFTFMTLSQTTSEKYILINLSTSSSNQIYFFSEEAPTPKALTSYHNHILYSVEHYRNHFFFLTNHKNASNFKVMKALVKDSAGESLWKQWSPFIVEKPNSSIQDISVYGDFLILEIGNNETALSEICVYNFETKKETYIPLPYDIYDLSFDGSLEPQATTVRLAIGSPHQPPQDIDLDLKSLELTVRQTKEVPNYDCSLYETKRVFAPSKDGEKIPLTLFYKKSTPLDGTAFCFIYGYGSYGYALPASFSSLRLSLVNRGFIFALAHTRGGSDKGYQWYLDGKLNKKKNTFEDFILCSEYLIKHKYTASQKLIACGGSAGGLLMGAILNMKPELFKAVIADVPFVDVVNTMSDEELPLTAPEWLEWGNPIKDKNIFKYMLSYSPYDNVQRKDYPHILFNSGISDEQVTYWEPTKMVAKLREMKTDDNLLLLNMKMYAGHAGASKKYEWIKDEAFNYAFILKVCGI